MPKKNTLLFFFLIIFSLAVMTYQGKKSYSLTGNFINNMLNGIHMAAQSLSDNIKKPFKEMSLRSEENKKLKDNINALLMERDVYQETLLENKRLKELLNLREIHKNHIAAAKIIARGIDRLSHTLILDKGLKDGIAKDMCAVTPKGLAGKIVNVSDSYSTLLLITDINFSAAIRFQQSRKEGILSGAGSKKCILKYIPYEEDIGTGDIVITSGMDSLFPEGIPVGYASKIDNKGIGGHFQYIEVTPFQDDNRIEEVLIIK